MGQEPLFRLHVSSSSTVTNDRTTRIIKYAKNPDTGAPGGMHIQDLREDRAADHRVSILREVSRLLDDPGCQCIHIAVDFGRD